jgi:ubiquitin-activating enzyme E1
VTLSSLKLWKTEDQSKTWELWLRELESFSEIPLFFQLFLKNSRCKDLLFKVLAGLPDSELTASKDSAEVKTKWDEEQKAAVQFNYKILSEAFSISTDMKLRETAMKCGLLPRILERLAQISGEKARQYEEKEEEEQQEEQKQMMMEQPKEAVHEKNVDKKKRKGVGYAAKVG